MKVYVYPADVYGCGCTRLIWVSQVLRAQGHDVTIIAPNDTGRSIGGDLDSEDDLRLVKLGQHPPDADVIVMQRVVLRQLAQAVPFIRAQGIAVVVDMDDDLTTIHPSNIAFTRLHPKNDDTRYYSWTNAEQACREATLVTVSTAPLLRVYAAHGRGRVLLNHIPARYLDIPRYDNTDVGWGGSIHSHPDDVPSAGASIARLIREGRTRFLSIGDPEGIRAALGLPGEPGTFGPVRIQEWPYALACLGVGIAPLADSQFNRAKSWLKPLEMAACGVPWVASPAPEYVRLQALGVGQIAGRPREWYRHLRALLDDPALRADQSDAGRAVAAEFTIEANAWRWMEAWADAVQIQRGALPPVTVVQ
jgi:glycosyltransferase involved in cell wall biosynthesis